MSSPNHENENDLEGSLQLSSRTLWYHPLSSTIVRLMISCYHMHQMSRRHLIANNGVTVGY